MHKVFRVQSLHHLEAWLVRPARLQKAFSIIQSLRCAAFFAAIILLLFPFSVVYYWGKFHFIKVCSIPIVP